MKKLLLIPLLVLALITISDTPIETWEGGWWGQITEHEVKTTGIHGVSGNVVGTTDTQTLTNKRLDSPKINEDVTVTSTATEINVLDGIPATLTATELGYMDGVTSGVQGQLDGKVATTAQPGFLYGVTLSFTDDSANYSVEPTITDHEMIIGIRNTVSGAVTWCKSTTAKTGAIGGIAADTVYYVHAAPSAGDFTITVNTTSTETGDDFIIGVYRTEKSTAEIAHAEVYGPVVEANIKPKSKVITVDRDATASVEYSGLGFRPEFLIAHCIKDGAYAKGSSGFYDGSSEECVHSYAGGQQSEAFIRTDTDAGNYIYANVTSLNNDGFTLSWVGMGTVPTARGIILAVGQ